MAKKARTSTAERQINTVVHVYCDRIEEFIDLAAKVSGILELNDELAALIHSVKRRHKNPKHLKDKLQRKAQDAAEEGKPFAINANNIFEKIDDLAGVRLLHIHTKQILIIHPKILEILSVHKYTLVKKPVAYTWDIENQSLLNRLDIRTVVRDSMYTSIHYVVSPPESDLRCELQVRTLAEEIWGEVSHTINYTASHK